jgi:arylformamidase
MKIWRDYDQAALDAQYGTRSQIGDAYESWAEQWRQESEATRSLRQPRLDIAYGPHARQRLDIFPPPPASRPSPIAVFFHGGFWRSRDKSDYSYVANGLAGLDAAVALVNYPLCPSASLDEIVRSARMSIRWLIDHAGEFGGDPRRIYVMGHSAGAHLAAMCCCGDGSDAYELPEGAIKGALLSSGLYELEPTRLCFANADVRLDADQVRRLSPMRLAPKALDGPMLIIFGGAETEEFSWQAHQFAQAMAGGGVDTRVLSVPDANHYTIVPQLAVPGTLVLSAFQTAIKPLHAA